MPKADQPGMAVVCVSMEAEAAALMRQRAAHKKRLGSYLSRLVYEDVARMEERQRIAREVLGAQQ